MILPHFESPDDLCWKWKCEIRNNTNFTSMDFIQALSTAYLTTCLIHDEDLEQLWWYVKQVQEVLYICVCVCVRLHGTNKNAINCFLHPLCHSIFLSTIYNDNDLWIKKCQLLFFLILKSQVSPSQTIYGYSSCYYNYLLQTSDASQGQW